MIVDFVVSHSPRTSTKTVADQYRNHSEISGFLSHPNHCYLMPEAEELLFTVVTVFLRYVASF